MLLSIIQVFPSMQAFANFPALPLRGIPLRRTTLRVAGRQACGGYALEYIMQMCDRFEKSS